MKKLRIGMVGAGNIANVHLNAYQTLDNVEIAAICDINAERLNETADLFNIEKRYATEAEMLANEQLDAADVCVCGTVIMQNAPLTLLTQGSMCCVKSPWHIR